MPNTKLSSRLTRVAAWRHEKSLFAWPVCCSVWFGACLVSVNDKSFAGQTKAGQGAQPGGPVGVPVVIP